MTDARFEAAPIRSDVETVGRRSSAWAAHQAPRVLARCSAVAAVGSACASVSLFVAMAMPRVASVAVWAMLGFAVAIVAAMVVAAIVAMRPPEGGDRFSIFA